MTAVVAMLYLPPAAPFPATASAEGRQLNGAPFPATASAEGRQLNGAPSPRKVSSVSQKVRQVSWLAASSYSLRLPEAGRLSGLRRFRSAYSCGAALALHQLPYSQVSRVSP